LPRAYTEHAEANPGDSHAAARLKSLKIITLIMERIGPESMAAGACHCGSMQWGAARQKNRLKSQ
jgi:hypothetical protein